MRDRRTKQRNDSAFVHERKRTRRESVFATEIIFASSRKIRIFIRDEKFLRRVPTYCHIRNEFIESVIIENNLRIKYHDLLCIRF